MKEKDQIKEKFKDNIELREVSPEAKEDLLVIEAPTEIKDAISSKSS